MPSMSAAQLAEHFSSESNKIRYTNKMLMQHRDRNAYPVVDLIQGVTGTTISAYPEVTVAVKDQGVANSLYRETDSWSETRTAIQEGKASLNSRRLLTVGAFITLVDEHGNRGVPLHLRSAGMPLAGHLTHPSGLASEQPHKAFWKRINEEAGYCYVDKENKKIHVMYLKPDKETLQHYPNLSSEILYDKMVNVPNIRIALAKVTGLNLTNADEWGIAHHPVESTFDFNHNQEKSGLIDQVEFEGLFGGQQALPACVHDDPKRQTVSLTVPLLIKMPFDLNDMHFIDPEGLNRQAKLYTESELTQWPIAKIPALEDFILKLNGQAPAQHRVARLTPVAAPAPTPAA